MGRPKKVPRGTPGPHEIGSVARGTRGTPSSHSIRSAARASKNDGRPDNIATHRLQLEGTMIKTNHQKIKKERQIPQMKTLTMILRPTKQMKHLLFLIA